MSMSENGHAKYVTRQSFCDGQISVSTDGWNNVACRHAVVKEEETFFPSEVEVIGVEPLFAGAKYERGTEDDVICMNSTETDKYLTLEDFPYSDEFCSLNNDSGISTTEAAQNQGQVLDSMLEKHDEQALHVIGNISNACPGYLSESGFAERVSHLDYRFFLENLRPDEYNENLEVGSDFDEKLHLAHSIDLRPHGAFDHDALHPDAVAAHGLHDALRSTYGRGTSILDKESLKQQILVGLSSLIDLDHTSGDLKKMLSEDENADILVLPSNSLSGGKAAVCTSVDEGDGEVVAMNSDASGFGLAEVEGGDSARKRTRRPTRRYIEESSEAKCTLCTERQRFPRTSPQDKTSRVRDHDVRCSEKPSSDGGWVSCTSRPRRGRPRKNLTHLAEDFKASCNWHFGPEGTPGRGPSALSDSENDDGAFGSPAAAQGTKCVARRKHHRLWTLAEVMKLIEGVSRYGVGRWTKIKRLLFSSSGHRTSVDLKDKWRNLLRASGAHSRSKDEIAAKRKPLSGLVPQSVLRRVRDLAAIYPYPRERASREPLPAALSPSPGGQHLRCSWSSS